MFLDESLRVIKIFLELEITHVGAVHYFRLTRLSESQYISNNLNTGPTPFHFNTFSRPSLLYPAARSVIPFDAAPRVSRSMSLGIYCRIYYPAVTDIKRVVSTRLTDVITRTGWVGPECIRISRVFTIMIDFVSDGSGSYIKRL